MKEIITVLLCGLLLFGCSSGDTDSNISSKLVRDLNPDIDQKSLDILVDGQNRFAFSLFKEIDRDSENTLISPTSISLALIMLYAGADGDTKSEMKTLLNIALDDEQVHKAYNKFDLTINHQDSNGTLKVTNSIWMNNRSKFNIQYLDTLMVNYGAGLRSLDFTNEPQKSRNIINSFVEKETNQKIKDLIPMGAIDSLTEMVVVNSLYFMGEWQKPFYKEDNTKGLFENRYEVEFMHQKELYEYYEDESLQALKIDYKGGKNSMIILLPFNDMPTVDSDYIKRVKDGFQKYMVTLSMPKFKFSSNSISLKGILNKLGMNSAFDSIKADFSKISNNNKLYLFDIVHKTYISVDESGTEAAAATAGLIKETGTVIAPEVNMSIDRAFIYMIVDNQTDAILFLGHLKKP